MNEKLDAILAKAEGLIDSFVEEFTTSPVRTTVKVLLVIYLIKKAKQLIRDIR